jgi:hypothetical protein
MDSKCLGNVWAVDQGMNFCNIYYGSQTCVVGLAFCVGLLLNGCNISTYISVIWLLPALVTVWMQFTLLIHLCDVTPDQFLPTIAGVEGWCQYFDFVQNE